MNQDLFSATILLLLVLDPFGNLPLVVSALAKVPPARHARIVLRECCFAFVILLGIAEKMGLSPQYIGYIFMGVTIGVYALIGIVSRTAKISEYYVAGRSVPAVFNGMATGSDWMSAASFIGTAPAAGRTASGRSAVA